MQRVLGLFRKRMRVRSAVVPSTQRRLLWMTWTPQLRLQRPECIECLRVLCCVERCRRCVMTADPRHIDILRRGPRPWNEWRAENPSVQPNLVGVSLSIGDRQLGPINGGPVNFARVRFRHAFLCFATLTGADLRDADLADADLRDARLEGANLCGASLAHVRNLTTAQLHEAEGDATTVLPDDVARPLIWTVAQVVDSQPTITGATARQYVEERQDAERQQGSEYTTWLVGGPQGVGRNMRPNNSFGESGSV